MWTIRRNEKDVVNLYSTMSPLLQVTTGGEMLNFGFWNETTKTPLDAQHDFIYPKNKLIRIFWNLYFVVLNVMGFFISDWQDVFNKLPKLIRSSQWLNEYENIMKKYNLKTSRQILTCGTAGILSAVDEI